MVGMFGLIGVVSIFVAPVVGRITDRVGVRFMIGAGASILILAFAFVSQAEHALWALICGITMIDIGYRAVLLANQTRIYPLQPDFRNRLNTMFMTFVFLGGAVGSLCGAVGPGPASRWQEPAWPRPASSFISSHPGAASELRRPELRRTGAAATPCA
jgi:predicted MFS family arabinose efflux permease